MTEIIRVFHATTHEGKADEFREFFVNEALPMVRSLPGLVSARAGLPPEDTPNSFFMITVWSGIEGLEEFAGENWREAVIDPREEHLLSSVSVFHYEAFAESARADRARAARSASSISFRTTSCGES